MVAQDPVLFAIVFTTVPLAAFLLRRLSAMAKKATHSEAGSMATVVSLMRETSQGIRMLKSFQLEDLLKKRMALATRDVENRRNKIARVKAAVAPLSEIMSGLAIAAVVFYGSWKSQSDPKSIGNLFSFITALLLAGEPLRRLSRLHIDLATAAQRISMLYDILDTPAVEIEDSSKGEFAPSKGEIVLRNVSFDYPGGKRALNSTNLTIRGGKTTALVGPSGGGKTTILGLLQGFFQPVDGDVMIDDICIRDISLKSLREKISYLDQEAFLFEGTIEDNIVGSCSARDHDRMVHAAKLAGAEAFILRMKDGYQTQLRELANNLSGGQKQRIGMARALYKDAPILLLDEPTSALDSASEQHIRRSLTSLTRGKTTVIVAHRLSTVKNADYIHVISEGTVVESGTHSELMAIGGYYSTQLRTYVVDDEDDANIETSSTASSA
jgi:subfamily B ATP-binding cassette protein MsbA